VTDIVDRLSRALANRYRLDRELGQSGMATVYLSHDRKHDGPVAIEVLRDDVVQSVGSAAGAPTRCARSALPNTPDCPPPPR
jgi:serine/threonine protein kinase